MTSKSIAEALARLAKTVAAKKKKRAAQKKAGTFVADKPVVKRSFKENQLSKVNAEIVADRGKGATNALLKKKESLTRQVKSDLTSKGRKFNSKDYEKFNKGGSVNSKKSCGLAVRGHGKVIK